MMPWHDMGLFKYSVKRRIVVVDAFGTVSVSMPNMLSLHGRGLLVSTENDCGRYSWEDGN
jgi:hypothetical protein